jgi:hypothetical protein
MVLCPIPQTVVAVLSSVRIATGLLYFDVPDSWMESSSRAEGPKGTHHGKVV